MHIGNQISAARGLLLWNVSDLADQVGLSSDSIKSIENGTLTPQIGTLLEIKKILGENGVEFTSDFGVYLRPQTVSVYKGQKGLCDFSDSLYNVLARHGGIFLQTGPVEESFMQYIGDYYEIHKERMKSLVESKNDIKCFHLLNSDVSPKIRLDYVEYRKNKQDFFTDVAFYSYGGRLAIASFKTDPAPTIVVHNIPSIATAYRKQFMLLWEQAEVI